ncbi:MAG: hypothetical protein FWE51_01565 [Coriobacteriia bacterium]|nr:hypothetical protein [Coriobacteriia bacterium]
MSPFNGNFLGPEGDIFNLADIGGGTAKWGKIRGDIAEQIDLYERMSKVVHYRSGYEDPHLFGVDNGTGSYNYDTGVEMVDGATYEIITSAYDGTWAPSASPQNLFGFPKFIPQVQPGAQLCPFGVDFSITDYMGTHKAVALVRYQERVSKLDPTHRHAELAPLRMSLAVMRGTAAANKPIDDETYNVYPTWQKATFEGNGSRGIIVDPTRKPTLVVGFNAPSGVGVPTNVKNIAYMIKVIETRSTSDSNLPV